MTQFISSGRTVSADLDDATQYATIRTVGVVHGKPEGTPIATLTRRQVIDHRSPVWQLYDTDGELVYSWRFNPPSYQSLIDQVARRLAR